MTQEKTLSKPSKYAKASHLSQLSSEPASELIVLFERYGRTILYVIAGLVIAFLIIYRYSSSQQVSAEATYINAETEFAQLQKNALVANTPAFDDTLANIKSILSARPELHAKYDALIAQLLLARGNAAQAQQFAEAPLARLNAEKLPFYADFATTTLLIENSHYAEALTSALAVKEAMLKNASTENALQSQAHNDFLFAFNLIRIASLQQQLGNKDAEIMAWNEWQSFVNQSPTNPYAWQADPQTIATLLQHLQEGKVSLPNYIDMRTATDMK